ncbi:hypothetical protein LJC55_03935 [Eubacteriales bacterium OttesenSCG-928-N14]|nr:hypothetical protein [Eubacteriales bacterium OttesenSCG-928-N14]
MKQIIKVMAMGLVAAFLLLPTGALAAQAEPTTTESGGQGEEVIPVYGYIGEDGEIVDPDPTDPTIPPEKQLYVEVPVKVMFAAFESGNGAITSPDYSITNLSSVNDVKVELKDFSQRQTGANLDGLLTLDLTGKDGQQLLGGIFPADYSTAKTLAERLAKKSNGSTDNVLQFAFGGNWSGTFGEDINPVFDMTLQFTVLTPDEIQ